MVGGVTVSGPALVNDTPAKRTGGAEPSPRSHWRDYPVLAVVAAGLWASFPDVGWWFLIVPTMALFVSVIDHVGATRATWYAGLVGFAFWMAHVEWARIATGGWLPWVALAMTQVLAVALWGWIVSITRVWGWAHTIWGQALVYALVWVGVEQGRARFPLGGFPWANLAYPQVDAPIGRLAPIGGEVLVSFLVVAVAVIVRRVFSLRPEQEPGSWWVRPVWLLGATAIMVAPLAITLPTTQEAGSLRVAVVQGNVEIPGNETFSIPNKVTGNHVRVTEELAASGRSFDVVFWGENAADRDPAVNPETAALVRGAVESVGVPVMVGSVEYVGDERYNWVEFWYPGLGPSGDQYGKQHPVPFGEYIPWRSVVSGLATEAAQVTTDMVGIDNPALISVRVAGGREVPMAVGICFEVAYEPLMTQGVRLGGQLIAVPTNNYHFRYSAESTQQAQMLRFRAMEFSRSALQASTNGVSMIVRPNGGVVAQTDKQVADFLVAEVPLRTSLTPAAYLGEFLAWVVIGGTIVVAIGSAGGALALRWRGPESKRKR